MPDLMQTEPEDSRSKWSRDGARLKATQDSTSEWRELGAQVNGNPIQQRVLCGARAAMNRELPGVDWKLVDLQGGLLSTGRFSKPRRAARFYPSARPDLT